MKKRMLLLTALAVLAFYLLSCLLSIGFQMENILTFIDARTQRASVRYMTNRLEEGKELRLLGFSMLYPHGPNGPESEIPYTAALWKVNGERVIGRGYTLTVQDRKQEQILWQGQIGDLLTEETKAALGAFLKKCPSRAVGFDSVSFATVNGEWVPTSLSMFSIHKANSVRLTVQLSDTEPDRTFTQADAYILFDFYDLGLSRKDTARFRRLEAMVSQVETQLKEGNKKSLFFGLHEYGKKALVEDGLLFDEERLPEGRLARALAKLGRLVFGDTLEWDAAALETDVEQQYIYFTASLCNRSQQVFLSDAVRQTFIMLGAVYGLMGAFLLIVVWRLLKKNERLDAARRALTAAAAHELKTPLSVIQNQSECVLEQIAPEKNGEYVDSIHTEAMRMDGIVRTLLQYDRLSNMRKIEKRPVDLSRLAREEAENYRRFAGENSAALHVSIADGVSVKGDETLLRLAADNYISNAVKYATGDKTVKITLRKTKRGFRFETENPCDPISKKESKALWTLLAKQDKSRGSTGAAGMGLPLCAEIFRLHGLKYGCEPSAESIRFYFGS